MTREFVAAIEQMAQDRHIPVLHFEKGQRKETIAEPYFAQAALLRREGVVLVGFAQEKANVFDRRLILFAARIYSHVFCRGLARLEPGYPAGGLNQAWRTFDAQLGALLSEARMAA
jgi:hypothetical protein